MKKLTKGNDAVAEAAIQAGCKAFFGYPITPQNEIPEYMSHRMPASGGVFVQAESEVAAINMVYGAASAGVRAMTSSASPGIALKQEGISYLCGANLPCLIVSVARCGPGLGGILPSQGDYFQATRGGGNGDYYTPVFAPSTIQEAWDLVFHSFDVADTYRTPVMLLMDGLLGQMKEPLEMVVRQPKIVEKPWATDGTVGKRARNIVTSINLSAEGLEAMNVARFKVYDQIRANEVMVENTVQDGDTLAIVAYGTPSRIVLNSLEDLAAQGVKAGLIRPISLFPYPYDVFQNLPDSVKDILVVELSMGQMLDDVKIGVAGKYPIHFYGRTGGSIFEPKEITAKALEIIKGRTK